MEIDPLCPHCGKPVAVELAKVIQWGEPAEAELVATSLHPCISTARKQYRRLEDKLRKTEYADSGIKDAMTDLYYAMTALGDLVE